MLKAFLLIFFVTAPFDMLSDIHGDVAVKSFLDSLCLSVAQDVTCGESRVQTAFATHRHAFEDGLC